ncbi:DUF2252 domain-containing protein [Vulcanococcus sp. Clear-D1]|uniref:DUF2252 domain-containing protein n=1 Tax=Vulcanococcus sp. Clear-D1 TaxID=2766970 RepID=UPI0019A20F81|nr:DUF2252 domain-containing protein [Vulcanococcus sp. Clear-D1]MBD1194395.1 DUF2252 domain-containing protein [Vulcanococcus sp. Clear-D1]
MASVEACLETWQACAERPDPIDLLEQQNANRLPWLIAERHRRMAKSPFAWFRGTAAVMARDLGSMPNSGLTVQLCGDAHLLNFGFYASPERTLVFDINDFDETFPGPWEWDLKRLLVSLVLVARPLGLDRDEQGWLVRKVASSYRKAIAGYAAMPTLELWSTLLHVEQFVEEQRSGPFRQHLRAAAASARRRSGSQAVARYGECRADGGWQLRHEPPLLWRHRQMDPSFFAQPDHDHALAVLLEGYLSTIQAHRRHLISGFRILDTAYKAVGVGSVGTRCSIALLQGPHPDDLLLLQSKQALASALAEPLGQRQASADVHQGQRVVQGQRLLQCVSDPFLGWTTTPGHHNMYWRQLRDWKASLAVEAMKPDALKAYGRLCASVLARAHARSGDRFTLAAALEGQKATDRALSVDAIAYADQVEHDHGRLLQAMASGRLNS